MRRMEAPRPNSSSVCGETTASGSASTASTFTTGLIWAIRVTLRLEAAWGAIGERREAFRMVESHKGELVPTDAYRQMGIWLRKLIVDGTVKE